MYTSPAPASSEPFQTYAISTPRDRVPSSNRPESRQTPVTHLTHVALLSPRMQGFYSVSPTFGGVGASASKVTGQPDSREEAIGDDNTIAQLPDSKTVGQISDRQVIAANVFPVLEPHYAGPIAVVITIGALIYYALYRFAGSGQKIAPPKESTGYPVTYHTDTQINYHYTDGEKIETGPEKLNSDKGD